MDGKHYNELIDLSQTIYEGATDRLTNYCAQKYCGVSNDTTEQQMEDYLFVAKETATFLFGNALALLTTESQKEEIESFVAELRRVIAAAQKKAGIDQRPN